MARFPRHQLLVGSALALGLFALAPPAGSQSLRAAPAQSSAEASDDGPRSGTLLLRSRGVATALPAVRLGTDMDVSVSGSIARVRVTQAFRNMSDRWMEASYLYPLPEDGAVDSLKMVVGRRVIIGRIHLRAEAKATYEAAKAQGRRAGLVEQQRPNMFTTNVANVAAGETVLIAIEYQAPVHEAAGTCSLRLPLVVGPRYVPPHSVGSTAARDDAAAVTASPVFDPKIAGPRNPVSVTVHLRPGFPLANVISRYHPIVTAGTAADRTVRLAAGTVPADRDFELDWRSAAANPTVGLFRERFADEDYVMATVTPPSATAALPEPPREMVFVIDNSGSMGGASMEEAKASLIHALQTLRPQDRFNVIRFDDTMTRLFPRSVPATAAQVLVATRFAQSLEANGGTEMLPALKAALADAAASGDAATLRQVIFLTDGEISNEQEMLATLAGDAGKSHVFLVGIGSAPNDHLMARMATIGRGTYTHVATPDEVTAKMMPLLDVLRHPAMRNLEVKVAGNALDLTPRLLPDLYPGQPLVLLGKGKRLDGSLTVSGRIGDRSWMQTLDLNDAAASNSVAKLWARRRIDDIEADRALGKIDDRAADRQVGALGLSHQLVTSQTSLVAVDDMTARPAGVALTREDLPINVPAGWDFDALFGTGNRMEGAADRTPAPGDGGNLQPIDLPQTATDFSLRILAGILLIVVSLRGLRSLERQRKPA